LAPVIINPYRHVSSGVGGWVELGRTTLGSATSTMSVSSLPDKRYYQILIDGEQTVDSDYLLRFNSDSGSNYARRHSNDGGSDSTGTSLSSATLVSRTANLPIFYNGYISNLSSKEKLITGHQVNQMTAGAGTAPTRTEYAKKWANTSSPINAMSVTSGSGNLASGSEIVVLGWDDADTHTDNFWEELASVELGSAADDLSSGTFTAKKYLWVQAYSAADGVDKIYQRLTFNGDTNANYSHRREPASGTEYTAINDSKIYIHQEKAEAVGGGIFSNIFIVNNSANEKLAIFSSAVCDNVTAAEAPFRTIGAGKWTNTSSQITSINLNNTGGGSYDTGSIIKVWGSN